MSFRTCHFRKAMEILEGIACNEEKAGRNGKQGRHIDGGYILVDNDSRIILDCQSCFSLSEVKIKNGTKEKNAAKEMIFRNYAVLPATCQTSQGTSEGRPQ